MRFSARLLRGWLWHSPFDEHIQRLAPSMPWVEDVLPRYLLPVSRWKRRSKSRSSAGSTRQIRHSRGTNSIEHPN